MPMKPLAGLFLALACVLGIAATGSVFELAYGDPELGVNTTSTILGLALPGTLISLLVAIRINKPAGGTGAAGDHFYDQPLPTQATLCFLWSDPWLPCFRLPA